MTQGLAIVCMVVLHLFCRQGADVLGIPLVWLNDTTPLVFWFGFFAEICVPLYAMCMGYAQELLYENGKSRFSSRLKRIGTLMLNYWVVLAIFSIVGLIAAPSGGIPGSFLDFVKAAVLIKSYNGAWWFLHTYVFLLLLPPIVLLFPVRKLPWWACVGLSGVVYGAMYLWGKLDPLSAMTLHPIVEFCADEAVNAIKVLPYVWVGALMCKYAFVVQLQKLRDNIIPKRLQNRC